VGAAALGTLVARLLPISGACGIPQGARAVSVNVTVVNAFASGHLSFYPGDAAPPSASTINFSPGPPRANNSVLALSQDGELAVYNGAPGSVDLILDVNGYFQ